VLVHLGFVPRLECSKVIESVVQCDRLVGKFRDLGRPCVQ